MRIGIHQPNFIPHWGFFYKMSMCDKFVILSKVQFEKGGYQNRYFLQGKQKWVTMPVEGGLDPIEKKFYTNGSGLLDLNLQFIEFMKQVLSIPCELVIDVATNSTSTQRLIDNLNYYGATAYVTSSSAKHKYLDEDLIKKAGMDVIYSDHPFSNMNILEMLETFGIEGTRAKLAKPEVKSGVN